MQKASAHHWATDPGYIPVFALGGAALGGGARLLKNLFDLSRRGPTKSPADIARPLAAVSEVPVEVSKEEAEELRKRGIKVRRALTKESSHKKEGISRLLGSAGLLGLGTLSTVGGWHLADTLIDAARKRAAKKDVDRVKDRIRKILEESPSARDDQKLLGYMKAAEDKYFKKEALLQDIPVILGGSLGITGVLAGLAAYNRLKGSAGASPQIAALKASLARRLPQRPRASLVPILKDEEEEEEKEEELLQPRFVPVERVKPSGSPAAQAAKNRSYSTNWL